MFAEVIWFPSEASSTAHYVDELLYFLVAVCGAVGLLVAVLVIYFCIRYRRRPGTPPPAEMRGNTKLELFWTLTPLAIFMVIFVWGATIYFGAYRAPDDAEVVYVVGKQWMWKVQHPGGQREINELHVQTGRPCKLMLTSEDVIHSFYMPAFRVKFDVLPGRYTTAWFNPTKPGKYHLFCAEYCGTLHSGMIGWIYVMEPAEYERWLAGGTGAESLASNGQKLFEYLACANCHRTDKPGRCPNLTGLFGTPVTLTTGQKVMADESYIRESILHPGAKIVAGYQDIMPTFQGLVSEEDLLQLIEYIKSLSKQPSMAAPTLGALPPGLQKRGTTAGPAPRAQQKKNP